MMTSRLLFLYFIVEAGFFLGCINPDGSDEETDSSEGGIDTGKEIPEGCAVPKEDTMPLKEAFQDHFAMGAALNQLTFRGVYADAVDLVERHFNRISPENDLKWSVIEPIEGEFDFENADQYVRFGEKRGMEIYGHVLVWHSQTPDWVFEDDNNQPIDRDGLLARVEAHIQALADRYGGRINYWDVVNEAFNDDGSLKNTKWRQIIGDDFIEQVFRIANDLLPDSKLVYNDYNMILPGKRDAAIKLVSDLRDAGLRIDALGEQGHYNLNYPSRTQLEEALSAYRDAGIEIIITELDVDVLPSERDVQNAEIGDTEAYAEALNPYQECLPIEVDESAAAKWEEIFSVFVENSDVINGVTLWGVEDGMSWLNDWPIKNRTNYPLLFNRDFQPKTSYERVLKLVQ
jgi:endo-1,4-beta-xylanase